MVVEKSRKTRPVAVGERHVLGMRRQVAAAQFLLQFHAHLARGRPPLLAFAPHLLQGPHAAFVARPPGLDALADPGFLLGQLLVEQGVLLLLGGQRRFLAFQKRVVIARPVEQLAAVELQDPAGQLAEEHAVVGHEHQRGVPAVQELLQPVDGVDVQMVGRLVQQQQIGLARPARGPAARGVSSRTTASRTGAPRPVPCATGCAPRAARRARPVPVRRRPAAGRRRPLRDAARGGLAAPPAGAGPRGRRGEQHLAVVRLDLAAQDPQQRRLAGAVASQQPDALAALDLAADDPAAAARGSGC